jgi:NAD(P) transhydrogenase subunit alpha
MSTQSDIAINLLIFVLSSFLGIELIRHVSRLLHTPLMSLTNAISSVSVVAALLVMSHPRYELTVILAVIATACSATNAIGGFLITERILRMFRKNGGKK